jgi:hypothetical protein
MAVNEDALEKMGEHEVNPEDLDMVIVIYAGTRVCAYSFGPGTPVMSLGPQATVYKLSYPDVTFEFRRVLKATPLTMGGDSDSFSFLIRDHTNGLDLRGQRTDAPSDWILISNPRGMGLGDTCEAARRGGGRVEGPDPIFEPAQLWNSHQRWAGQDRGDLEDTRRQNLDDARMQGATRFTYDRYLTLPNPTMNFHVAFTRGAVIMQTTITNQTKMVLPEFQANEAGDIVVDVDQVRPWGLAEPEDQQAPPERDEQGRPSWVADLTSSANNWKTRAITQTPEAWFLEPPPLPEGFTSSSSSDNQAPEGLRLSPPPPGLAPTPESETEDSELGHELQAGDLEIASVFEQTILSTELM